MAMRINANDVSRSETLYMDPFSVEVREENRGRRIPPTAEDVIKRALSLLQYGQLEPVECRKDDATGKPLLNSGFTRVAACRLIRTGFNAPNGEFHKDEKFKVWVKMVNCNSEQAFLRNIEENAERNATTAIDDAHNQNRLRSFYNKTDQEIAEIYHYKDVQKVYRLKKLLALDFPTQELVHYGRLSVTAAIDLLDVPEEERAKIIAAAQNEDGKVKGSLITDQVRDRILNDLPANVDVGDTPEGIDEGVGDDVPDNIEDIVLGISEEPVEESEEDSSIKKKPRSMANLKKFWTSQMETEDDDALSRFAKDFLDYIAGGKTDKQMVNAIKRFRG